MKVFMERVENGIVVKKVGSHPEDPKETYVCEEKLYDYIDGEAEVRCIGDALFHAAEGLGLEWGKRRLANLKIATLPGSSYEGVLEDKYVEDILETFSSARHALVFEYHRRKDAKEAMPKLGDYDEKIWNEIIMIANEELKQEAKEAKKRKVKEVSNQLEAD